MYKFHHSLDSGKPKTWWTEMKNLRTGIQMFVNICLLNAALPHENKKSCKTSFWLSSTFASKARFATVWTFAGRWLDLTSVKKRKLKWYGHVTRSSWLDKTILQGTVQGGRRRGRQRKRWEENIKEWTGLERNVLLRKTENREEWRKLVVKSTMVPQRSARLRDR